MPGPLGLQYYDIAPSGKAVCLMCGGFTGKGSWRFHYRIKESNAMRDLRWVHASCLSRLPETTRALDRRAVHHWFDQSTTQDSREMLREALVALGP